MTNIRLPTNRASGTALPGRNVELSSVKGPASMSRLASSIKIDPQKGRRNRHRRKAAQPDRRRGDKLDRLCARGRAIFSVVSSGAVLVSSTATLVLSGGYANSFKI